MLTSTRSHGKWRPMLASLVKRNTEAAVRDQTREAFKAFSDGSKSPDEAKLAISTIAKLQGIGPATASLLLSVFDPRVVPFFSDALFRWCLHEDGTGKGGDRKIKYDVKEYVQLYSSIQKLRARFEKSFDRYVSAVEIEKVAYVLGKTAAGGDSSTNSKKRKAETESEVTGTKVKADVKRPDTQTKLKPPTQPARNRKIDDAPTPAATRPKRVKK